MTQLEKIRRAKGFLQDDMTKACGDNTSTTDVDTKLTVANDLKTENKIINLRKSLNTLASDEGEEISQFTQANLDAGVIDEDMLHIFDDYSNGEENAMEEKPSDEGEQPSDKGEEPIPQFFQSMIDNGFITAEELREWYSYLEDEKGEENTRDKESDDGEKPSDEGEEEPIPQFFQSIIDAGFATADMMHIFDNPSEGEENATGDESSEEPSDKGGEEPLSQFYQANIDAGVITADMLHVFDNPSEVEDNAIGEEPSDKGEEPIPQFYQAMIDAGIITPDMMHILDAPSENNENATDTEGDDGEIENLVNTQTLEKDAEAATEAEDKLIKIIDLLGENEQKKVKTYLTKHPTDKEFLLGLLGKHPKLLFSETSNKSSKNGVRLTYYVISDTNERPTRISATLKSLFFKLQVLENGSDVIGKLDEYNKKLKKGADAAKKEILGIGDKGEEDDEYKREITIDDYDDYLAEVKKEEGREYADEVENLLSSDATLKDVNGKALVLDDGTLLVKEDGSLFTWDAFVRIIACRDLQLDYNINLEKLEKEFNLFDEELDIVKDYYYTLWDKFQGQGKRQLSDVRSKVIDEIKGKESEKPQKQTDTVGTDSAEGNISQEDLEAATALVLEWGEKFF